MPLFSSLKWIAGKNADDSAAASSAPTNDLAQLDTRSDSFLQCLDQLIEEAQSEPHRSSSVAAPPHSDLRVTPSGHASALTVAIQGQGERYLEDDQPNAHLLPSEREEGEVSGDEPHVDSQLAKLKDRIARLTRQSSQDVLSGRFQSAPPGQGSETAVDKYNSPLRSNKTEVFMPRGTSADTFAHYGRQNSLPRSQNASSGMLSTSRHLMPPPTPALRPFNGLTKEVCVLANSAVLFNN